MRVTRCTKVMSGCIGVIPPCGSARTCLPPASISLSWVTKVLGAPSARDLLGHFGHADRLPLHGRDHRHQYMKWFDESSCDGKVPQAGEQGIRDDLTLAHQEQSILGAYVVLDDHSGLQVAQGDCFHGKLFGADLRCFYRRYGAG